MCILKGLVIKNIFKAALLKGSKGWEGPKGLKRFSPTFFPFSPFGLFSPFNLSRPFLYTPPVLSTLVLNYRSPRDTRRCVDSLRAQTVTNDLEILVIDNKSDDESIQWLRNSFRDMTPQVRIIEHNENIGYGQGNTQALRYAKGDIIYITNPDNELEPAGLEKMCQLLNSDPTIGIIAPKLVHDDGTVRDSSRAFPHLIDVIAKRMCIELNERVSIVDEIGVIRD